MEDGAVIEQWSYRFTGATIMDVAPLALTHVQFDGAPVVLYGVNGAGKTRAATAIAAALQGKLPERSQVILHGVVAVNDEDYDMLDLMQDGFRDAHQQALMNSGDYVPFDIDFFSAISTILEAHIDLRKLQNDLSDSFLDQFHRHLPDVTSGGEIPIAVLAEATEFPRGLYLAADMSLGSPLRQTLLDSVRPGLTDDSAPEPLIGKPNIPGFEGGLLGEITEMLQQATGARGADPTWPTWASWPVMRIGDFVNPLEHYIEVNETSSWPDVDSGTAALLTDKWTVDNLIEAQLDTQVVYSGEALDLIDRLSATAQQVVAALLPGTSPLQFDLGQPSDWLAGARPQWKVSIGKRALLLTELSGAERRWYTFGLATALALETRKPGQATLTFLDEPERGLHRAAEARLPQFLSHLKQLGFTCIVATHSPNLLNAPGLSIHHVQRNVLTTKSELRSVTGLGSSDLDREAITARLGLTPADLFQLTRVFVCVEGEHDLAVVEAMLGPDLDESYAKLIPLRGAKGLRHLAAVPFLFDFTDANVLVVLDNLGSVAKAWSDLRTSHASDDRRGIQRALAAMRSNPGGEGEWLAEFAEHASKRGVLHRVQVFGLQEPDIICYLPPACFLPDGTETWPQLLKRWRSEENGRARRDLKTWLRETRRARITTATIRKAAESQTSESLPEDLVSLGLTIRELGTWSRLSS